MSQEGRGTEGGSAEAKKYVVFCADGWDYGDPGYIIFTHEADVMMIAAAGEVESGKLTPAEARKILEPYREMLPSLYTDEHRPVFDPGRRSWNDPDSFPQADYVQQSLQASQVFWHEVDKLRIEGLFLELGGISPDFPLEDEIFSVEDKEALKKLKEKVSDKYEIVVKKAIDEFDAMGKSVEWAKKLIEEATITKAPQQSRLFSDTISKEATEMSGETLVYGDDGQGGLVFLEEDYIAELGDFCDALQSAGTWEELRDMVSEERYQETVERRKDHEDDSSPDPEDDFEAESLSGYEDGDFPEFAPTMMDRWVDKEIIDEYGGYGATMTGYTAAINFENEEEVVSLLEEQGYVCTRDDTRIWNAVWRG